MFFIEEINNVFQLTVLALCMCISIYKSVLTKKNHWALIAMFYSVSTFGVLYWFLYLIIYGDTPYYSFISDMCWFSAFLFLLMLLLYYRKKESEKTDFRILIPTIFFTAAMAIFYMRWGKYLINTLYAAVMTFLIYHSIYGLNHSSSKQGLYYLYFVTLLFCIIEYCLWTISCFDWNGSFIDPYHFFDLLLTVSHVLFYFALKRIDKDELH